VLGLLKANCGYSTLPCTHWCCSRLPGWCASAHMQHVVQMDVQGVLPGHGVSNPVKP
jgi:hypothetical protein